jgi:site-specific recombinase XerD
MPRRGDRLKLALNIYEDASGRSFIIYIHGKPKEFRRPPGYPLRKLLDEQADMRAKYRASGLPSASGRGTLAEAVDSWEPLEQGIASWKERRAELRAWIKALGPHRQMHSLTERDCRRVMSDWARAGVAPKTIRQRHWSFKHLFRVLYGADVVTPLDHIDPPPIPRRIIVPTDTQTILTVYRNLLAMEARGILRDAKTRARFMVRAATGRRPSEIMRAEPADVDLKRREWRVRDGKGGWSAGQYLNDDMRAAWKLFIEAQAWGKFNTGAQATTLRSAGWPEGVRPYNLRHSLAIALIDAGEDLTAAADLLGHKDLRTTRRNYAPIRKSRIQQASELLEGRFKWKE